MAKVEHLYKNFLSDRDQFAAAKKYWGRLAEESLDTRVRGKWRQWLSHVETPDDRSASMFSLWDETVRKAFSIEQMVSSSAEIRVGARMDVFGRNHLDQPIDALFIWCELSKESAAIVAELIRAWSKPEMDAAQMSGVIASIVK